MKSLDIKGKIFSYGELNALQLAEIVEIIGSNVKADGDANMIHYIGKDLPKILAIYLDTDEALPESKYDYIGKNISVEQIKEVMSDFFEQSGVFGLITELLGVIQRAKV